MRESKFGRPQAFNGQINKNCDMTKIKNPDYQPLPEPKHREKAGDRLLIAARLETEAAIYAKDPLRSSRPFFQKHASQLTEGATAPLSQDLAELKEIGAGGELPPYDGPFCDLGTPMEKGSLPARELRNTVKDPSFVTIDANRHRLELASRAGALEMGLDLADTVQAGNSLEKMLCHQLAATHRVTMQMFFRLNRNIEHLDCIGVSSSNVGFFQTLSCETSRLAGTVARLQSTFQEGILALQKLRTGGRQTVTVQHVNVEHGGQAVVAGQLRAGRPGGPKRRGTKGK
jgi:hypothetical protein